MKLAKGVDVSSCEVWAMRACLWPKVQGARVLWRRVAMLLHCHAIMKHDSLTSRTMHRVGGVNRLSVVFYTQTYNQ